MALANRNINVNFSVIDCCSCGMVFAVPKGLNSRWQSEGETATFYCPIGHPQSYVGQSDAQKLAATEKLLKNAQKRTEWAEHNAAEAREEARLAENRRRGEKAAKTRIKNRIANGVCPCCNRTFKNLHRHMENQHPDFAPASATQKEPS